MSTVDAVTKARNPDPLPLPARPYDARPYRDSQHGIAANRSVGDVLSRMGVLDSVEVDAVLALQEQIADGRGEELIELVGRKLGYILLRSAAISEAELDSAIREHEVSGRMLGEVLVNRGAITQAQLDGALRLQKQLPSAAPGRFRLGQMLVDAGVISRLTLDECIARQRQSGKKLGETLVEAGAISPALLVTYLARQRRIIAAAATAIALMSLTALYSPQVAAASSATVHIHVTVMKHASITGLRAPREVELAAADIARGYLDVQQPIEIDLRTNNPEGVILAFSMNSAAIASASLRNATDVLEITDGAVNLRVPKDAPGVQSKTLSLRVRLNLARGLQPGTIAWPLAVIVAPA